MPGIKYEIINQLGVLSKAGSGRAKELNLISWNDREPKYDLRDWLPNREKLGKSVTLSKEELLTIPWMDAGWLEEAVDLDERWVRFVRH